MLTYFNLGSLAYIHTENGRGASCKPAARSKVKYDTKCWIEMRCLYTMLYRYLGTYTEVEQEEKSFSVRMKFKMHLYYHMLHAWKNKGIKG